MAENSAIEWTHHTFNPWIGCTKISPACDHCYAENFVRNRMSKPQLWQGDRQRTAAANWQKPLSWDMKARKAGERQRVFCASLADVFDNQVPADWRSDLWALIRATPSLDWLLLTKRPQNITKMLPGDWFDGMQNVWLGTTVENQAEAERRIPHLLSAPARVHFLSCEPLLGPVDLTAARNGWPALMKPHAHGSSIGWVIAGGESGPGARPSHPAWFRSLRDQCAEADVPFLFKQWGEWSPYKVAAGMDLGADVRAGRVKVVHPSGLDYIESARVSGGLYTEPGSRYMVRSGKKAAGRLLEGNLHDDYPMHKSIIPAGS